MKKIVLALLLISFLALPVIGLEAAPLTGCREIATRIACERTRVEVGPETPDLYCWWHDPLPEGEKGRGCLPYRPTPKVGLIDGVTAVINIIFTILMAAAVLFVMIGAFQFITAGGDTEKVTAAREKILYAVIAVVVALLSWGIIEFIRRGLDPGA